jgi:hypothetical protein
MVVAIVIKSRYSDSSGHTAYMGHRLQDGNFVQYLSPIYFFQRGPIITFSNFFDIHKVPVAGNGLYSGKLCFLDRQMPF